MEDRSQLLIAATEAFALSNPTDASSRMYEELALQHLSRISAESRLKIARLLSPLAHAPETVMHVLANDHDLMIEEYVAQSSKGGRNVSAGALKVGHDHRSSDRLSDFLKQAPISHFHKLEELLADHNEQDVQVTALSSERCMDLAQRALKFGHTSLIDDFVKETGLSSEQVHSCCTNQIPDGFIIILLSLGFAERFVDQLLVRFWGTLIDTDAMRDLQKTAAGVRKDTARKVLSSWTEKKVSPRYQGIFEAAETAVRDLNIHSRSASLSSSASDITALKA